MVLIISMRVTGGAYFDRRRKVERTFEISGSATLEDLTLAVLSSVNFDADHLYEYEIGGKTYTGSCYGFGKDRCRVKLYSLALRKGDVFRLTYDFGDDWRFAFTVLEVKDEKGGPIRMTAARGEVEQYPDWDEEEDEDYWDGDDEDWDGEDDEWDEEDEPAVWTRLASDEMLDAAFRYRKTKLWKLLNERQVFAVRLSNGEIGFVSVLGAMGEHCALVLYHKEGFESYRRLSFGEPEECVWDQTEWEFQQDCIQLILDNKEYLRDEEIEAVKRYCDARGIRIAGAHAYPHIWQFRPNTLPWQPSTDEDLEHIREAVEAAVFLAGKLGGKRSARSLIDEVGPWTTEVPLIERAEGGFFLSGVATVPEPGDKALPRADKLNEIALAGLKRRRKKGIVECRVVRFPVPVQDSAEEAPYFPAALIARDRDEGFLYRPELVKEYEDAPEKLVNPFIENLVEEKRRPAVIRIADERTRVLLAPFAERIGAALEVADDLPELEAAIEDLFSRAENEKTIPEKDLAELMPILEAVADAPPERLKDMPTEVRETIRILLEEGAVPDSLAARLRKKLFPGD